jgi:hypothetical protein
MKKIITTWAVDAMVGEAHQKVEESFERFFLMAGMATLSGMWRRMPSVCVSRVMLAGVYRTGIAGGGPEGKIGFHGGTVPDRASAGAVARGSRSCIAELGRRRKPRTGLADGR